MMQMNGVGLAENDPFAKTLRMLADLYKCLKNVATDCQPHCRIVENALRMLRTLTNAVTNNANVRTKRLCSECSPKCFHLSLFISKQYSKQYQSKSKSPTMPWGMEKIKTLITDSILLLKHTALCCYSQIAI